MVDVELKVWALLQQWVKRLAVLPSTWVSFFSFWCARVWNASPVRVLSAPSQFGNLSRLPCFYVALLSAWKSAGGCFRPSRGVLSVVSGLTVAPVSSLTTKSAYSLLLIDRSVVPHCVEKFSISFGQLYWSTTWRQLSFIDIDLPVIELCWKIAHGVLYTAELLDSFGYDISTVCFCGHPTESLEHLFFHCPLEVSILSWLQSLLTIPPLLLVLSCRVMFCLVFPVTSYCVFLGSLFIRLTFVNFLSGWLVKIFVFAMFSRGLFRFWRCQISPEISPARVLPSF